MNVLFLTMNVFTDIEMHNIYSDLMKEFIKHGHRPYIVTPREKKLQEKTELINYENYSLLKVRIGNTSNVSLIEKGLSTVTLSSRFFNAVKKMIGELSFGLILYSTPPITLAPSVKRLKKHFGCRTYLMLKDIFPQNAVDLGMFSKHGLVYRYFRRQESRLYEISDRIGCMSKANVDYILEHNKTVAKEKVEICPNAIIAKPLTDRRKNKEEVRNRFGVPQNAVLYLYGGNLGKPQGIPHMIRCLEENENKNDRFFIICGNGSEYHLIEDYISKRTPPNVRLVPFLEKEEYDSLVAGCDVGLVFLDARFTIPNYPSRILTYMENEVPFIVCSDNNTDVGLDAQLNKYGLACFSSEPMLFTECVNTMNQRDITQMGRNARLFLEKHFTADYCFTIIMAHQS